MICQTTRELRRLRDVLTHMLATHASPAAVLSAFSERPSTRLRCDTAGLELEAARSAFNQLGATPDQMRVSSLIGLVAVETSRHADAYGLTDRELQVLRLVALGQNQP
jgi:DNA-binding NarL/FixJ family response regulator